MIVWMAISSTTTSPSSGNRFHRHYHLGRLDELSGSGGIHVAHTVADNLYLTSLNLPEYRLISPAVHGPPLLGSLTHPSNKNTHQIQSRAINSFQNNLEIHISLDYLLLLLKMMTNNRFFFFFFTVWCMHLLPEQPIIYILTTDIYIYIVSHYKLIIITKTEFSKTIRTINNLRMYFCPSYPNKLIC